MPESIDSTGFLRKYWKIHKYHCVSFEKMKAYSKICFRNQFNISLYIDYSSSFCRVLFIWYLFWSQKSFYGIQSVRLFSFFPVLLIKRCGQCWDSLQAAGGQTEEWFYCFSVQKPSVKNKKTAVPVLFLEMCAYCVWKAAYFFQHWLQQDSESVCFGFHRLDMAWKVLERL